MSRVGSAIRLYLVLAVTYLVFAMLLPANKLAMHDYHLSSAQYHSLLLVLLIPYIGIWFAAFYGAAKLSEYAETIKKAPEGLGFYYVASGFKWLALGLPLPALITLWLNSIANAHQGFLPAALIISNYLNVIVPLVAFHLMGQGTRELVTITKSRLNTTETRGILLLFLALGVAFCFFTFRHLNLHSLGSTNNPYYLPGWLLIVTLIIPYLYAWFTGLLAAYEMILYGRQVSGVFYRQALGLLAGGMTSVIASLIIIQYIHSVTPRTGHLSLNTTLLLINIIYVFMAIGFIAMSFAASKLKRIEEV